MEYLENMEIAKEQMNKYDLIMLYFTASWCGPCRMISPFIEELIIKIPSCKFLKVDVDDEKLEELVSKFNINSMPTFCFIKNQELIHTITGADKDKLLNYFQHDLNISIDNNKSIDNLNKINLDLNTDTCNSFLDNQFGSLLQTDELPNLDLDLDLNLEKVDF
jgi:thiol-disulfide isomerase/thioredoxin